MTSRLTTTIYTRFKSVLERATSLSTRQMGGRERSMQAGDVIEDDT